MSLLRMLGDRGEGVEKGEGFPLGSGWWRMAVVFLLRGPPWVALGREREGVVPSVLMREAEPLRGGW